MIIKDFQGRDWDWDFDKIAVDQWREVKRKLKMTPKAVQVGIDEADPDSMTVVYWTMLQQAGLPSQPLGDALKPDILALNQAVGAAAEVELADRQAKALAEMEEAAARAAELAPTSPGGPPSPEPPSPATTTPMPPASQTDPPMTVS
jgi:hypothetical protein